MATVKNLTINDSGYIRLPNGTTAQRPGSPTAGMIRYNSDLAITEYYTGSAWTNIANQLVTNGLVLALDAGNTQSYSGSGSTWYDLSGNGNHMTLVGSPSWSSSNGGYFTFNNATTNYASIANANCSANLKTMTSFSTISGFNVLGSSGAWHALYTFGDGANFVDFWQSPSAGAFHDDASGYGPGVNLSGAGFNIWSSSKSVAAGNSIYQNGTLIGTQTLSSFNTTSTLGFTIAVRPDDLGYNTYMNFSFLYIYNRALTASEMSQTFNALRARYGL
jgi:hypothetical protein